MSTPLAFPVSVVRDALITSDFRLLCTEDNIEHYVREGRHVAVRVTGQLATVEFAEFTRNGRRITVVIDGAPAEMFHVREEE